MPQNILVATTPNNNNNNNNPLNLTVTTNPSFGLTLFKPKPSMYDVNVQNLIAKQQVHYLISQMENYHPQNPEVLAIAKQAHDLNSSGNVQAAASLIYVLTKILKEGLTLIETYQTF